MAVVVMGIVNAVIRPVLKFLTLPISCLTFGLFSFVINAVMFWLVGALSGAFRVDWLGAFVGSILISIVSGLANLLIVAPAERLV
jgi:putative membrane protein